MRALIISALAVTTIMVAGPAAAQVRIEADRPGVAVQVAPTDAYAEGRGRNCRTVTTRIKRPNGTVITKRERRCGRGMGDR